MSELGVQESENYNTLLSLSWVYYIASRRMRAEGNCHSGWSETEHNIELGKFCRGRCCLGVDKGIYQENVSTSDYDEVTGDSRVGALWDDTSAWTRNSICSCCSLTWVRSDSSALTFLDIDASN